MPFIDYPSWRARACRAIALLSFGLVACAPPRPPVSPSSPVPSAPPVTAPRPPAATAQLPRARSWDDYKLRAAQRIVAANPAATYSGPTPDPLLAIPVLEVDLNADGSVQRISVQRAPSQAKETVQIAIDAVKRAAPFGDVSHLPKPWRYSEVFLFDDNRRFKPRLLDN